MSPNVNTTRINAVELRTPAALQALARRFAPVVIQESETPVPKSNDDYFSRMMLPTNVELDSGNVAVYDAQSDTRFLKNYVEYHIASRYPEYNVKGHPIASPLSLAGYCLLLFYAFLLNCDASFRPMKSYWCIRFFTDQMKRDLNDLLLNAHVPQFLADLLMQLSPVYDARRANHIFVPSLAGYSHLHDFGRTIPARLYFKAHHLLATTNPRTDPDLYQDMVYELEIVDFSDQIFTVANYFGTRYEDEHSNWVNQDFEAFFNPLVGRALIQKPTFAKMDIATFTATSNATFDPYTFFLCADDASIFTTTTTIGSLSTFFHSIDSKSPKLGSILSSLSGILALSHSIEPPTLPTWTGIKPAKKLTGSSITDAEFAKNMSYLTRRPRFTGKIAWLHDETDLVSKLYLLKKTVFDNKKKRTHTVTFDPTKHVAPYVLYFQPYDVSPSSLGLTIACGLKIELAEIDGFTIPTEHPESSLDDNNSQYLQSAVRMSKILPILSSADPLRSPTTIIERRSMNRDLQAIGLAIRSMASNILPVFSNENVDPQIGTNYPQGLEPEDNHDQMSKAFTYTAGVNGLPHLPDKFVHAWSSYRVVHSNPNKAPTPDETSMVLSFRPIYGLNVTLSRSKNPSLLIPH
jgi:hypothetical protein